jgi:orotidine-5'-phosphate decarboxylase
LEATLEAGLNAKKEGLMLSASRSIIFASDGEDFAEAAGREARLLKDEINKFR